MNITDGRSIINDGFFGVDEQSCQSVFVQCTRDHRKKKLFSRSEREREREEREKGLLIQKKISVCLAGKPRMPTCVCVCVLILDDFRMMKKDVFLCQDGSALFHRTQTYARALVVVVLRFLRHCEGGVDLM